MTNAGIYVRISLDRTGQQAGVKRQEADCRRLARSHNWAIAQVFSDNDMSASKGRRRPGYEALLEAIREGQVDAVLAWHPDRLYRHPKDLESFVETVEAAKAKVLTVHGGAIDMTTASGRMVARMLGAAGRHEVERMSERVARWHEDRAAKGLPNGGGRRPYGYEWDQGAGTWRIRREEARIVRRIARDLIRGRSLSSVVKGLNLDGIPTASGGRWANGTVTRLMRSPTAAGLRVHKRTGLMVVGNWPAIITPQQRELLLARFSDPARPKRGGGPTKRLRLLSGLLVCGRCEQKMYGDGPGGYACHKSWKGCGRMRIASAPLEDYVFWVAIEHLHALIDSGEIQELDDDTSDDLLIEERLSLLQKRDVFAVRLADGTVDERAYRVGVAALDERIDHINEQLSTLSRTTQPDGGFGFVFAPVVGQDWTAALKPEEVLQRYDLLVSLLEKVVVAPASRRGVRWEPERLTFVWRAG